MTIFSDQRAGLFDHLVWLEQSSFLNLILQRLTKIGLEYFLKSVTNLSRQIVQEGPKTETRLLQKIGRNSDLLHITRIK